MTAPEPFAVAAEPSTYTVFPEELRDTLDATTWQITVEYRGATRWAVCRGRRCLNADGYWDYEAIPSEREDDWLARYRHDFETAMRLAKEALPGLTVNGMTAADVVARHRARSLTRDAAYIAKDGTSR